MMASSSVTSSLARPKEMADEFGVFDAFLGSVLIAFVGVRDGLAASTQVGNEILWQFVLDKPGAQGGLGGFRGGRIAFLIFKLLMECVSVRSDDAFGGTVGSAKRRGKPFSLSSIARAVRAMFWKSSVRASKSVSLLTRAGVCPACERRRACCLNSECGAQPLGCNGSDPEVSFRFSRCLSHMP
jgi:hypothetical protein